MMMKEERQEKEEHTERIWMVKERQEKEKRKAKEEKQVL